MNQFYVRKNCRLCGSNELDLVLPLKKSPLCDAYSKEIIEQDFYDVDVFLCKDCSFVQISTILNPRYIYKCYSDDQILDGQVPLYPPTSGHSRGLKDHFRKYAEDVMNYLNVNRFKLVVDIGSSDGTLLGFLKHNCNKALGIEVSKETAKNASLNGIETLPEFFHQSLSKRIVDEYGNADLIIINNLFANIDELYDFMHSVELLLDQDGILVIESSYLLYLIRNMVFDFIYHEHLSYFCILPLITFFKKFKMRLIHLQEVPTKGGSLRYYWAREGSKWNVDDNVGRLIENERKANIDRNIFDAFRVRIDSAKQQLIAFLLSQGNKTIVGYGASATSTTLISHFQLNEYLNYLVDDNPSKIGTHSPGYHLPVYGSSKLFEDPPDIVIILAWRFKEKISNKLSSISSQAIVPLPKFEIIRI